MTEPARLRDEGPEHVRALLRAGAPTRPMTTVQHARTAKRVARYAAAAGLAWAPAAALGAGAGAVIVIAAWVAPSLRSPSPPPPPPAAVSAAPRAAPPAPEAPSPKASAPQLPPAPPRLAPAPVAPRRETASPAPLPDSLAAEAALLERAHAALAATPEEALAVTGVHAARFPAGKLGLERELIAVDALRRLGRVDEARARCEALLARARGSLYEERARKLLEGMR